MNNNDKLVRIRYALDIKDQDMLKIFNLGGVDLSKEELHALMTRTASKNDFEDGEFKENIYAETCSNRQLESFLNGFITFKRGKKPLKPGEIEKPLPFTMTFQNSNNVVIKKLKIALALTTDEMITVWHQAGMNISASELGAILRKEGHRNYQVCGDKFTRKFLKGLGVTHRQ